MQRKLLFWRLRLKIFHVVATFKYCPILFKFFNDFFSSEETKLEGAPFRNHTFRNKDQPNATTKDVSCR